MSQLSIVEKLRYKTERNLLIQGLPSSIEKQFAKMSFSKNVTPLLRNRKIDWALVFAVNENQLNGILKDVVPALHVESKLWVAYPKTASKILSDLNRNCTWAALTGDGFAEVEEVALDHVWSAIWWSRNPNAADEILAEVEAEEEVVEEALEKEK